jgi:hypothetical protein
MPNWCSNNVIVRHEDPEQIAKVVKGYSEGSLFSEFFPCPAELSAPMEIGENYNDRVAAQEVVNKEKYGYTGWHDWCINNWGTKWDAGNENDEDLDCADPNMVQLSFDTAWQPPVAFFEKLTELGFDITALYLEEGQGFVGKYTNAEGDESFNFDGAEDLADIPDDIRQFWDLDTICEWREESDLDLDDEEDEDEPVQDEG